MTGRWRVEVEKRWREAQNNSRMCARRRWKNHTAFLQAKFVRSDYRFNERQSDGMSALISRCERVYLSFTWMAYAYVCLCANVWHDNKCHSWAIGTTLGSYMLGFANVSVLSISHTLTNAIHSLLLAGTDDFLLFKCAFRTFASGADIVVICVTISNKLCWFALLKRSPLL